MNRREFGKTVAAAGAVLAASPALAGPATSDMRSNFSFKKDETPVILEVAINGSTTKKNNPAVPETASELAEETIKCLDAGATIVHAHTNKPSQNVDEAVQAYVDAFTPVRERHPHGILYPTANFDPAKYHEMRTVWPPEVQSGHYRPLAEAGLANMILLDTGVVPLAAYDDNGLIPEKGFWWYGFWPGDNKLVIDTCNELGCGASISVFEPGWMKNVGFAGMPPPIPEALQLYLHMIEGLDLKWSVGVVAHDVMETPLAQMALERGGSFRVGLEDWATGPSNLEQMERAKELINKVGRSIVTGADAIKYLDIPFPATRPK
jgi:uncharacterized protein (DUF849 family)